MVNHSNPLQIVLDRAGYADPAKGAFFFWDEVKDWPAGALDVLVTSGLVQQAQPMATIECDGCEENCIIMRVEVYPAQGDKPGRAFIICDKPVDMGRIRVSFDRMRQWQVTGGLIAAALARLLGLPRSATQATDGKQWNIGTFKGKKHNSPVALLAGGSLTLALAGHTVPLVDVLAIEKNALALDKAALTRLVDNPAGDAEAETKEARRERIKARIREEKAKGTKAFLRVVAEEEGISESRIKQLVKDDAPVEEDELKNSPWADLLTKTKQTSSKKPSTKY
ncbi:MAG TPA: hypothetical protein VMV48_04300 [Gallionellaceae bacterium]|nr:hypothetical protein [Gallionellaceae bacterium]